MLMKLNIQLFASGGNSTTLSSGAGNKATLSVSFYETNASEPNVKNNTTNISASATMKMTSGSFSVSSTWHVRLYWHDNKSNKDVEVANTPVSALSRNQSVTASASFDVEHNADGTLSGYAIAKWDATGGNYTPYAGQVDTGWIALTTIPRTTNIGNFTSYINNTVWIGWSPASNSFRHTLTYTFNGKTRTIGTNLTNGCYFTPPKELYAEMSGKSGNGTLTLTTYSGSNPIGSKTSQITINAVETDVKPIIDEKNAYDTNDATISLTTGSNVIVANKSLVQFNLNFHTRGYAKAKTLTINGVAVTIPNGTVDEKDASITAYNVSVSLGTLSSNSISISLTDTRDYPATDTYPIEDFISYISLDIAPTFKRIAPTTGEVGLSFSGNYFNNTFGKVANSLSIGYKYKENDATEYSDLITLEKDVDYKIVDNTYHSGNGDYKAVLKLEAVFDYKKLYNVQLFVNDAITTLPVINVTITKGIPIFWWNGEKVVVNGELYIADSDGQNLQPVGGGDTVPVDAVFEYSGTTVPEGYELVDDNSFCQVYTYGEKTYTSGGTNEVIDFWTTSGEIRGGQFSFDTTQNGIKIPAGSANVIQLHGQVAGYGNFTAEFCLFDSAGNRAVAGQQYGVLVNKSGNGYHKVPISNSMMAIPDTTQTYYLKLIVGGYNDNFTINTGFGYSPTVMGVRKIA